PRGDIVHVGDKSDIAYSDAETNLDRPIVLNEASVAMWRKNTESRPEDQYESVNKLMQRQEYAPTSGIVIEGKTFLLSNILADVHRRDIAIGYVYDSRSSDDRLKPRLFYKSSSDGVWHAAA